MSVFESAYYVQLQSPVHRTYINAAEDGRTVCLDAPKTSHNSVWAVEWDPNSHTFLLRGAYGRYLGAPHMLSSKLPCPRVAAAQHDFDKPHKEEITWRAIPKRNDTHELKSMSGSCLCAGFCFSTSCRSRKWNVHVVPRTCIRPPPPPPCGDKWPISCKREVHWVLAERSGEIKEDDWGKFLFVGRDSSTLETELQEKTKDFPMSIFVRAGCYGRPTPLCVHLPRSRDPLYIVGFWSTSAADHLFFPDMAPVERELDERVSAPLGP